MTKFGHQSQLPKIFAFNKLSILPITRGKYIVSSIQTFSDFDNNNLPIERFSFPSYIESIDYNNITSESTAINCAYVSGILEDFLEEEIKPTISGRMSSSSFEFNIDIEQ